MNRAREALTWVRSRGGRRAKILWGIAAGLAILLLSAYAGVSYFIASGVSGAERGEFEDHPLDYGLEYEDVGFMSRKGDVWLEGWYLPSDGCEATVVMVHGISSNRTSREATMIASRLVDACFNVLLFDLRAHGTSEGERITGGIDEAEDVLGAYDYLQGRGIGPDKIGVLGRSMGAGATVLAAAEEPGLRAVVLDSTYAKVNDLISFEIGRKTPVPEWAAPIFIPGASVFANVLYGIDLSKLAPEKAIESVELPILVVHGDADTRIPLEHGLRVHRAAYDGSEMWIVPGAEHGEAFDRFRDEYVRRVVGYLESRLGVSGTR